MADCTWGWVSSGLVLSYPAHSTTPIKNNLCQDKQRPGIQWIFLSRDNEVWLTPTQLNWASATGLFQRQWEGLAENQNQFYLQERKKKTFLKKEPGEIPEYPLQLKIKQRSQQQLMGFINCDGLSGVFWIRLIFHKLSKTTAGDAETSHQVT